MNREEEAGVRVCVSMNVSVSYVDSSGSKIRFSLQSEMKLPKPPIQPYSGHLGSNYCIFSLRDVPYQGYKNNMLRKTQIIYMNQAHMALIGSSCLTGFTVGQNAESSSGGLDEHSLSSRREIYRSLQMFWISI